MDSEPADGPLSDVTVIELGNLIAAPYTGLLLADLGATVVKVERPETGDLIRQSGDAGGAIFAAMNRNKRSIALDLQTEAGRESYQILTDGADVVIENLSSGTADKLGIGYEALSADRDDLIYASISGFLDGGPYENRPGMDVIGQAMSGMMKMNGTSKTKPLRAGTSVVDIGTGMFSALGVMMALWDRERTGKGQRVNAGLFESAAHWMNYWAVYSQQFGDHPPLGSTHPAFGLYDVFETQPDEWLFIAVVSEHHWTALLRTLDVPELAVDERFETNELRIANKEALVEQIADCLRGLDRSEIIDELLDAGIPAAPVNDPSDLIDDPHLDTLGLLDSSTFEGEQVQTMLTPFTGDRVEVTHRRGAPDIGGDTSEVLEEFGLGDRVRELKDAGAFGGAISDTE